MLLPKLPSFALKKKTVKNISRKGTGVIYGQFVLAVHRGGGAINRIALNHNARVTVFMFQ